MAALDDAGVASGDVVHVNAHATSTVVGDLIEARSVSTVLGSGAALVDTLYTWNAVEAVLAAVTAADHTHGESLVVTNGEPRPVGELITRIAMAGGAAPPRLRLPAGVARRAGALVERRLPADVRRAANTRL